MDRKTRILVDVTLLVAFLAAYYPSATGVPLHELLCLAVIAPALFHLVVNWEWVAHTSSAVFTKIRATSALNLVVDGVLFLATVTVMVSGFMVSQTLAGLVGVTTTPDEAWHVIHSVSADVTMLAFLAHAALHVPWFVRTVRALASAPARERPAAASPSLYR